MNQLSRSAKSQQDRLLAQSLYDDGRHDVATICTTLGISRATLYRAIKPRTPESPAGS